VKVNVRPDPLFSVSDPGKVCQFDSARLIAAGGDLYAWHPADGLSRTDISNPWVTPSATTEYVVTITETTCNQSATLSTKLTVSPPPTVTAFKSNDIDCSNDRSQLNATGADAFTWAPAITLSNPGIRNPIATPSTTTGYIVKGTDASGCSGYDTITVKVDNVNKGGYLMPNAFTPDNDGLNDCFRVKYWGVINDLEFSIYNRWGERIFFTRDVSQCWDGTYKGVRQDGGVYVYMIKAKTNCEPDVFRKGTFVLIR
jgi:gliding motility-associated-like protein